MSSFMNNAALLLGVVLCLLLLDRLRQISWRETKAEYVALYLSNALWTIGIFNDALHGGIEFYQFAALVATLIWLHLTRKGWRNGPPGHMQTVPGDLGPPIDRRYFDRREAK